MPTTLLVSFLINFFFYYPYSKFSFGHWSWSIYLHPPSQSNLLDNVMLCLRSNRKQDLLIISIFATKLSFLFCWLFKKTALILLFSIYGISLSFLGYLQTKEHSVILNSILTFYVNNCEACSRSAIPIISSTLV